MWTTHSLVLIIIVLHLLWIAVCIFAYESGWRKGVRDGYHYALDGKRSTEADTWIHRHVTFEICPNCDSTDVYTTSKTESFPYGRVQGGFQATFPVLNCVKCNFGWRDWRSELAIEKAITEYREREQLR